ncbi:MAG: hypothetical protein QG657_1251, partial [Acidobacteriota bacterium]|nr:hypothetical protein [Acidobacteriota bacterium]
MSLEAYWLEKFSGNIEKKSFPFDHKAPVMNERRIERNTDRLPGEIYSRLLAVTRNSNLQLYKLLVSGVVLLLREYTGGGYGDVIVGEPVRREDDERINTALALKCSFDQTATFKEFFLQAAQVIDAAYAHRRYPMHLLLWHLNLLYAEEESPLFDVTVSLDNLHDN